MIMIKQLKHLRISHLLPLLFKHQKDNKNKKHLFKKIKIKKKDQELKETIDLIATITGKTDKTTEIIKITEKEKEMEEEIIVKEVKEKNIVPNSKKTECQDLMMYKVLTNSQNQETSRRNKSKNSKNKVSS